MNVVRTIKITVASVAAAGTLGLAFGLSSTDQSAPAEQLTGTTLVPVTTPDELVSFGGGGGCQYCHDRFPRPIPDTPRDPGKKTPPPRDDEDGTDPDADSDSDEDTDVDTDGPAEIRSLGR